MTLGIIWSDLHHSLVADANGNVRLAVNIEAVKTSIDNIIRTAKGERIFRRNFGGGFGDMLFEPIDDNLFNNIAKAVKETIEIWDNRVSVTGVDFKAYQDRNYVELSVNFVVKGYIEILNVKLTLTP